MKNHIKIFAAVGLFCLFLAASCKKSSSSTTPTPTSTGSMHDTTYIGSGTTGFYWNATSVNASKTGSVITITGTAANGTKTELNLANITGTGAGTWDASSFARYFATATDIYSSKTGGGGTFDITSFSSTKIEGTFFIEGFNAGGNYYAGVFGSFSTTY